MVERHEILEMMTALKRAGMATAFDELASDGLKRRHLVQRTIGALLRAGIADKQAGSITYQMSLAGLPPAKAIDDFEFAGTPINEPLVRDPAAPGPSRTSSATWRRSAAPARAISPSRAPASAAAPAREASTPSIRSTGSRPRPARAVKATSRINRSGASEQGLHLAWLLTNLGFVHAATSREKHGASCTA